MQTVDRNDPKWTWIITAWKADDVRLETVHAGDADKDTHLGIYQDWLRIGHIDRFDARPAH